VYIIFNHLFVENSKLFVHSPVPDDPLMVTTSILRCSELV